MPKKGDLIAGKYRLLDLLGKGGFGTVYRARHEDLQKEVALKVLNPEVANNEDARRRFLREIESSTSFVHKHAVQVREVGRDPELGCLFFTMDLVSGPTVRQALEAGNFSEERTARMGIQVLMALEEAHRSGIVHRDLKPENIMLTKPAAMPGGPVTPAAAEEVRVLDFGIAKAVTFSHDSTTALTLTGVTVGTLHYMSPEQAKGAKLDGRADLYSLAVVLYECLSGTRPIEADPDSEDKKQSLLMNLLVKEPRDLAEVAPGVSPAMRAAIMRALEKKAQDRFEDARSFRMALEQALDPSFMPTLIEGPTEGSRPTGPLPGDSGPLKKTQAEIVTPLNPGTASYQPTSVEEAVPVQTASYRSTNVEQAVAAPPPRPGRRRGRGPLIALIVILVLAIGGVVGWGMAPPELRARLLALVSMGKGERHATLASLDPPAGQKLVLDSPRVRVRGQLADPASATAVSLGEPGKQSLLTSVDAAGRFDGTLALAPGATAIELRAGSGQGEVLATIPLEIKRAPAGPLALVALSPPPDTKVLLSKLSLSVSGQVNDPDGGPLEIGETGGKARQVALDPTGKFGVDVPLSGSVTAVEVSAKGKVLARIPVALDQATIALAKKKEDLAKVASGLAVNTTPDGAYVLLDDARDLGKAPLAVTDVAPGKHKLVASLDGYEESEQDVEVASGTRTDATIVLERCRGTLVVETTVAADLELRSSDGSAPVTATTVSEQEGGRGTARLEGLAVGVYHVRAQRKGFDDGEGTVEVKRRKETQVSVRLAEHTGAVYVRSNPPGLPATLDGASIGETPVRKEGVPAGDHDVQAVGQGNVVVKETIRVRGDETKVVLLDVDAEVKKEGQAREQAAAEASYSKAFQDGDAARLAGQADDAVAAYLRAIQVFPDRPDPYFAVACSEAEKGDLPAAEQWLERAVAKGLTDPARILSAAGLDPLREDRAYRDFMARTFGADVARAVEDRAAEMQESRFETACQRGAAARQAGKPDVAVAAYQDALAIFPDRPEPYFQIACASGAKGDAVLAETWLEKAVGKGFADSGRILLAQDLDVLRERADYRAFMAKTFGAEVAKAVEERARTAVEARYQARCAAGRTALQGGRLDDAIATIEEASRIFPDRPDPYYDLARAQARKGDEKKALDALQQAIDKGYGNMEAILTDTSFDSLKGSRRYREILVKAFAPSVMKGHDQK